MRNIIATEFTIPGLEVIKAYRLNNQAHVSKSQLCLATRNHKNTQPLDSWLDAGSDPSGTNGSESFPQGFDAYSLIDEYKILNPDT